MTVSPRRIRLRARTELSKLAEEVRRDKEPRVLVEEDGEPVAAIVSVEDLERMMLPTPTPEGIQRALGAAGVLSESEGEELLERVYRWRHESPPSPPPEW